MDIEACITLLVSGDGVRIEIQDDKSSTTFFRATMTTDNFCAALGRLGHVPLQSASVHGLGSIGKKMEIDHIIFPIGECGYGNNRKETALKIEKDFIPDGWVSDGYYGSQNSFPTIDGVQHARVTIRRWV